MYIYERQSTGKYLLTSPLSVTGGVVTSISLHNTHAAIGVETYLNGTGQVLVYAMESDRVWRLQSIVNSAGEMNSYFGHSVCIGNHTLIVGAPGLMTDPFVGGPPSGKLFSFIFCCISQV